MLSQPLYTIKTSPYSMANCLRIRFKLQPSASHNHHLHKQLPHDKKPHANHKQALGTVITASCSCQPKASCIQPSSNPAKVSKSLHAGGNFHAHRTLSATQELCSPCVSPTSTSHAPLAFPTSQTQAQPISEITPSTQPNRMPSTFLLNNL